MGGTPSKRAPDGAPSATLFYASYQHDPTWQAWADMVSAKIKLGMVDVAKHPDIAKAERLDKFPTLVCISGAGVREDFCHPSDLLAEYRMWAEHVSEEECKVKTNM